MAINLKTTVLVSQAAIAALAQTQGCIVNFASIAYFQPQSPMAVYSAAKAAVAGFTQSLAAELRDRKIRVNAVAPGMVRTGDNVASAGAAADYVELEDYHGRRDVARGPILFDHRPHSSHRSGSPRHQLMELRDRVALVTGAGRRLGQAFARALAGRGMSVAIHHHASAAGADELRGGRSSRRAGTPPASPRISPIPLPPSSCPGGWRREFGRLDVLVNSAAVMHRLSFEETTPDQWDAIMALNLRAAFFVTQGAASSLRAARGKVVNIADLSGSGAMAGLRGALGVQGRRRDADQGPGAARSRPR